MSYKKPELIVLPNPIQLIQGTRKGNVTPDSASSEVTACAYEADE
jgi:hypothetical protein